MVSWVHRVAFSVYEKKRSVFALYTFYVHSSITEVFQKKKSKTTVVHICPKLYCTCAALGG